MTIILFLVDTSASMNQRIWARPTLLDVAKDAVEKFIKIRQRDSASRGDRYMLLTFEEPPSNIKAGWKESHATFMTELKNLQALGMTTMGAALKNALDLLNINRMQTGIDTYGQGRSPFYLEPSIILLITDGGKLAAVNGLQEEFNLNMHSSIPGSELTKELYRWDQRMFALILRLSGTPPLDREVTFEKTFLDELCEATGGRSYSVSSQRTLMQSLDSLVLKIQGGVVINFEKIGSDPPPITLEDGTVLEEKPSNGWHSCRRLIYVQRSAQKGYSYGHWPIPESFWPDQTTPALPSRTAHPIVKFTCTNHEPMVIDNLPFDKYELEPSSLTQYILSRKQPAVAWQVFVANSHKNADIGLPFGYLKASTSLTYVSLYVMPYNYPVLLPLLDDLFKVHRCKPSREWKQQFDNYLKNMPLYYAGPLKRALTRMGGPTSLVPDNMENCLSYNVINYLKRLKNQAKAEYEKLINSVGSGKPIAPDGIRVPSSRSNMPKLTEMSLIANPFLSERFSVHKAELNDFNGFMLAVQDKDVRTDSFRNAFDILRGNLLDQIARMRANFLQTAIGHTRVQHEDQLHSLPVSQMGNYQEYLKRMPTPLRELESTPVRQHMFGNPFKIEKQMMVDEADIDLVGGGSSPGRGVKRPNEAPGSPRPKRRPGPLPKDFKVWKPRLASPSPPVSPIHDSPPPSPPVFVSLNGPLSPQPINNIKEEPAAPQLDPEEPLPNHHPPPSKPSANHVNHNGWKDPALISTIKTSLFKEVRKPGKNFGRIFEQLESLPANADTQVIVIRDVMVEAARFKRTSLIRMLEDLERKLTSENSR